MEWMGVAALVSLGTTLSLYLYYRMLKSNAKKLVREVKELEMEKRYLKTKLS